MRTKGPVAEKAWRKYSKPSHLRKRARARKTTWCFQPTSTPMQVTHLSRDKKGEMEEIQE
jgi:hypothetical protein